MSGEVTMAGSRAMFPSTQWSLVRAAASRGGMGGSPELAELCRAYWSPLYAYLRRKGKTSHDAEDLVQGFLAAMISRGGFGPADPGKGPFRRYLLTCLGNWVTNQEMGLRAAKRGGGRVVPIEPEQAEHLCGPDLRAATPEAAFDQRWVQTLLARAVGRLAEEQAVRGKSAVFESLVPFLDGAAAADYAEVGERLGMEPGTVAQNVRRLRLRLREFVRDEVRQTVGSAAELEAEMGELLRTWNS